MRSINIIFLQVLSIFHYPTLRNRPLQPECAALLTLRLLCQEFSEMFGGQRCRPPHVHAETFKDNVSTFTTRCVFRQDDP